MPKPDPFERDASGMARSGGYPVILCGDHAGFEIEHLNMPPHERPDWPLPSFDARDWAAAFRKTAIKLGYSDMDQEWLTTWFANALMRGYDERTSQERVQNHIRRAINALGMKSQTRTPDDR